MYDHSPTQACYSPELLPKQEYFDEDQRSYLQDRVKKDNHNRIERRRRYNINDRIKELGTLVPKSNDPDIRWNKGSILKASVDHMRDLQRRVAHTNHIERKQRELQHVNSRLMLRIQELETLVKCQGIEIPPMQDEDEITNALMPNLHDDRAEDRKSLIAAEEPGVETFTRNPSMRGLPSYGASYRPEHPSPPFPNGQASRSGNFFVTHSPVHFGLPQFTPPRQCVSTTWASSSVSSFSPTPSPDDMTNGRLQQNEGHCISEPAQSPDPIARFNQSNTSFSSMLNDSEVSFEDMLLQDSLTPVRTDIFLSKPPK